MFSRVGRICIDVWQFEIDGGEKQREKVLLRSATSKREKKRIGENESVKYK